MKLSVEGSVCRRLVFIAAFLMSMPVFSVDCGPGKVLAIQSQLSNVLVKVQTPEWTAWKNLGEHRRERTRSYQDIAQQALVNDLRVTLGFPDGHNCAQDDYRTVTKWIRVEN